MSENILMDSINIKTLPEMIVNFLRENNVKTNLNSVRIFYTLILEEISSDVRDSYLNRIQKYLSSNEASNIAILDDISNGIYDKQVKKACHKINNEISKANKSFIYTDLINRCYFIHFEETELQDIEKSFKAKNYDEFIFLLFKHATKNYKINTPKILAERLFNDADTLSKDSPLRKSLYKMAADLGHQQAALEYANLIYKTDHNERLIYLLKAKDLDTALWRISFIIEHFELTRLQFEQIKKELKYVVTYSNELEESNVTPLRFNNEFEKSCISLSFKIYLYLAKERNFTKGYNSIGKFLINEKVAYFDESNNRLEDKSKAFGIECLKKGVSLSNIHAMSNLAMYYKKNNVNTDKIKPLLEIGAECEDLICCVELAKVLLNENKTTEAINYLKHASSQKSTYADYNLGKIYENKFDYEQAIYYYKKAIANGMSEVALDLALVYFQEYLDSNDKSYLLFAINILENHQLDLIENKDKATKLITEWNKILESK